jgi:hypothetical protein
LGIAHVGECENDWFSDPSCRVKVCLVVIEEHQSSRFTRGDLAPDLEPIEPPPPVTSTRRPRTISRMASMSIFTSSRPMRSSILRSRTSRSDTRSRTSSPNPGQLERGPGRLRRLRDPAHECLSGTRHSKDHAMRIEAIHDLHELGRRSDNRNTEQRQAMPLRSSSRTATGTRPVVGMRCIPHDGGAGFTRTDDHDAQTTGARVDDDGTRTAVIGSATLP